MTAAFEFHPEARREFIADIDWYDDRDLRTGERFESAVRCAIDDAVESPDS
jgi:hypothetical protein